MSRLRWHLVFAALVGIAVRLFFVLYFSTDASDTPVYEDLATNWMKQGAYALLLGGRLSPGDARVPGYPAFLVMIYALTGRVGAAARLWVMLGQVIVDLGTCLLTAALAAVLAPKEVRRRVALIALWFAATCPFLANYCGVPLTEVLATFFITAALLCLARSDRKSTRLNSSHLVISYAVFCLKKKKNTKLISSKFRTILIYTSSTAA